MIYRAMIDGGGGGGVQDRRQWQIQSPNWAVIDLGLKPNNWLNASIKEDCNKDHV